VIHFVLAILLQSTEVDPNRLDLGRRGVVTAKVGSLTDLRSGKIVTTDDIAASAGDSQFVFLGEQHATTLHQAMEATIIKALVDAGRNVTVGMEMFTRPKQDVLDLWSGGGLSELDFVQKSEWKTQWGYPYGFYRPVFETVRGNRLPLVALNVPREWVHAVGQGGYDALPTSAKLQLPSELFLGNQDHRRVFDALMGGHSMAGTSMDKMYAAQVLWDEAMADTALKYRTLKPLAANDVFVVIAGAGHVMYDQGINYRIARRKGGKGLTVVMLQSDAPVQVSRGLADFVYVTPAQKPETER
jgi:uncharacterized iron-regulated protein